MPERSSEPRRILVTGAAGRLGRHVCRTLVERGHDVRATDRKFLAISGATMTVGDLRDEGFVYSLTEKRDAVVHLGNYPHAGAGPSRPSLLAENTAMNANVMYAAVDRGIDTIVFASSVQAMIRASGTRGAGPFPLPYLPLDGAAPADPGNPYGLSKEYAERLLQKLVDADPKLSATAVRFPMLPDPRWLERIATGVPKDGLNWADGLTYLPLDEAADVVERLAQRRKPGYAQLFPATHFDVSGYDLLRIVSEHYPSAKLRVSLDELESLVDMSFASELGLSLRPRVRALLLD